MSSKNNRINGMANDADVRQRIAQTEDVIDQLKASPNLLDRIIFNNQMPGIPLIPGPICKIQTPGGLPPGTQANMAVTMVLSLLAQGRSEEEIIESCAMPGIGAWLTHDDIMACRLWFKRVSEVCADAENDNQMEPLD